jgi:hypothetical protein
MCDFKVLPPDLLRGEEANQSSRGSTKLLLPSELLITKVIEQGFFCVSVVLFYMNPFTMLHRTLYSLKKSMYTA